MDIGVIRGLITLVLMAAFVVLVVFVWSRRRTAEFEYLSRLPLEELPEHQPVHSRRE